MHHTGKGGGGGGTGAMGRKRGEARVCIFWLGSELKGRGFAPGCEARVSLGSIVKVPKGEPVLFVSESFNGQRDQVCGGCFCVPPLASKGIYHIPTWVCLMEQPQRWWCSCCSSRPTPERKLLDARSGELKLSPGLLQTPKSTNPLQRMEPVSLPVPSFRCQVPSSFLRWSNGTGRPEGPIWGSREQFEKSFVLCGR